MILYTTPQGELNQGQAVKAEIIKLLDAGISDKQEIYNRIASELNIKRPTIRRIAREVKFDLEKKVAILSAHGKHWL